MKDFCKRCYRLKWGICDSLISSSEYTACASIFLETSAGAIIQDKYSHEKYEILFYSHGSLDATVKKENGETKRVFIQFCEFCEEETKQNILKKKGV